MTGLGEKDWSERCKHLEVEGVRSFGGDLLAYQCKACLAQVKVCGDCRAPLTFRHQSQSVGCVQCKKGKFCNVFKPLCALCGPVQDGICLNCHRPFSRTGRDRNKGKLYCNQTCRGQAYRARVKGRGEALPPAIQEAGAE